MHWNGPSTALFPCGLAAIMRSFVCIVISVYVLGADFWERLNGAFEWQKS
jgi:hypothetical protein